MKRAFTLIEVNLAILAMSTGVLSILVLYTLGFRENRQNQEDLTSSAYADAVFGPIVAALSSKDVKWSKFNGVATTPGNGWAGYVNNDKVVENHEAEQVLKSFGANPRYPTQCKYGLVVCHEEGSAIMRLGFRASKNLQSLLTAPLYYTEVRFQGDQE